ncbi:MAG: glycoside hydrolase [Selenomonadales bacterium]|nr:glycoside hydrolase [Selenomonadales bacterium]
MKKKIVIASLCLGMFGIGSVFAAAPNMPVYWQADGDKKVMLTESAYEEDGQLWIPSDVVKTICRKSAVVGGNVEVTIPMARVRTEYKDLNRLMMREMKLSFPLESKDGRQYFAVTEPADVLGIEVQRKKDSIILKEERGRRYLKQEEGQEQPPIEGKINLVWDVMTDATRTKDKIAGLDILSPTWFDVADADGNLTNKAERAYVDEAHAKGYRVWALVTNSFDRDLTREVLADPRARQNVIRQLAVYSLIYDLDGINIDFENVYDEDKDRLTAFVGEMSDLLRQMGLISSIDVTVPAQSSYWSLCFDRKALAEKVDYMMVMTYDEHWAACPVSGSVASLPWVETNIEKMLKLVPKEKLLLGIPLYTREWIETNDGGRIKTRSKTLWMEDVDALIAEKKLTPTWLAEAGQDYLSYEEDGKTHRIWIENAKSIQKRLSLVHKYELAGAASWRKGFETDDIWPIYQEYLKPTLPQIEEVIPPDKIEEDKIAHEDKDKKKKESKKEKRKKDKKKKKHQKDKSDDFLTKEK